MNRITIMLKAIRDLGLPKLWYYALYKVGLHSGHFRRVTPPARADFGGRPSLHPYSGFPPVNIDQQELTLIKADEICKGKVRLFGGEPVPLDLHIGASSDHWTALEGKPPDRDIKFIWEPGRFGWAITLARAYAFSGDPAYARNFWDKTLTFLDAHPPNLGRQWQSAQEVAIRLMALVFCDRVFATAQTSKPEYRSRLWQAIVEHARRIPPTIVYARAQNNNHLLSEAAGLYTAGLYLADHPEAQEWQQLGWQWLNWGFQNQINEFGTYIQHSVNYHRLMLQLALYTEHIREQADAPDWPMATRARIDAAVRWLWALTDKQTGAAPNLGANDGAYIFPLTALPIGDYRPVVDAAAKAFLDQDVYGDARLSEMADWFNLTASLPPTSKQPQAMDMLRVEQSRGRAFLRAAHFTDRPSHADQLHTDLWWRGINVARDPGTFQYNAEPPWDNPLISAKVHNTLIVDGHDQMTRAGKFLWLDWAQAEVLVHEVDELGCLRWVTAEHDGFGKMGIFHQRTLATSDEGFIITDAVISGEKPDAMVPDVRLTWLLPDWDWAFDASYILRLCGTAFAFQIEIAGAVQLNLYRAGERLHGQLEAEPTWGWASPTYGVKEPALMLVATHEGKLPIKLQTFWKFDL